MNKNLIYGVLVIFLIGLVVAVEIVTETENKDWNNISREDIETLKLVDATDLSYEDLPHGYEESIRQFKSNNLTSKYKMDFKIRVNTFVKGCDLWNVSHTKTGVNTLENHDDFDNEDYFVFCENEIEINKTSQEMNDEFDRRTDAFLTEYAEVTRDRIAKREAVNIPVRSGTMVNG